MNITTRTSLVGFLLAVSAFSLPVTATTANSPNAEAESASPTSPTIESRLSRLTAALRERAEQLPEASEFNGDLEEIARGWANGRGGGGWVNANRGGFVNRNPWRNGWADRGSFFNSRPRWVNGGSFLNRR